MLQNSKYGNKHPNSANFPPVLVPDFHHQLHVTLCKPWVLVHWYVSRAVKKELSHWWALKQHNSKYTKNAKLSTNEPLNS